MSSNAGNLKEADLVPGAFPSEDAVVNDERDAQESQNSTLSGAKASAGGSVDEKSREFLDQQKAAHTAGEVNNSTVASSHPGQDEKAKEFLEQQEAAHTAAGQKTDKYTPGLEEDGNRLGTTQNKAVPQTSTSTGSGPGQNSEAWTDVANPGKLVGSGDAKGNAHADSERLQSTSTGQSSSDPQSTGESSIGSGFATMATAVGLAAKDAFFATKDAAGPAATAATEQAKNLAGYSQENAAPAASSAAPPAGNATANSRDTVASGVSSGNRDTVPTNTAFQTAGSAATYAKETANSAANVAQSYAPNVLGGPSTSDSNARDIVPEVPRTVQESVTQAGKSPEAATNPRAVEDKAQMEKELLGQSHTEQTPKPHVDPTSRVKGLEEQLAPESMTPGVVTVLGTEQDRSFPLGVTDHSAST